MRIFQDFSKLEQNFRAIMLKFRSYPFINYSVRCRSIHLHRHPGPGRGRDVDAQSSCRGSIILTPRHHSGTMLLASSSLHDDVRCDTDLELSMAAEAQMKVLVLVYDYSM